MPSHASLSNLPRFPLSIILAYLQQPANDNDNHLTRTVPHNRAALSFLLTTKRLAYALLPLFRLPKKYQRQYEHRTKEGRWIAVVETYRFLVIRIQDPRTLLDRLNTRRLGGRISWTKKRARERRRREQRPEGVEVEYGSERNGTADEKRGGNFLDNLNGPCYQHGRSIEEMAFEEWAMMEIDYSEPSVDDDAGRRNRQWRTWPAHLELLQFIDGETRRNVQVPPEARHGHTSPQSGGRPSPLSFRSASNTLCNGASASGGHDVTLLSSYPRSGNTLLRTLLERITSIVTGSDTRPDRTLSKSLAVEHDLVGEGLVGPHDPTTATSPLHRQTAYQNDPRVSVVKTHFPERRGWKPVAGRRVLLLVRNPYDAIDSYWNLCCTNTHTHSLAESVYAKYAHKFECLARHEIKVWLEFHYYWLDACAREGVPLLVVRYEDLVLDTAAAMRRVVRFLRGRRGGGEGERAPTPFWDWRLRRALGTSGEARATGAPPAGTADLGSYRPRSSDGGRRSIGKSLRKRRYPEGVLRHMHEVAAALAAARQPPSETPGPATASAGPPPATTTLLQQFGYDIYTQQFPQNCTVRPAFAEAWEGTGTVTINDTPEIRDKDDTFGRAMTFWRRGETEGDTKPFPTIARG